MLLTELNISPSVEAVSIKDKILNAYQARRQERNVTVHCSDTVNCLRRTCFSRIQGSDLDEKTLRNFLVGEAIHRLIQQLLIETGDSFTAEKEIVWFGLGPKTNIKVVGHVDIVWTRDDGVKIPVEIKTTNSKFIDGPSFLHRKQLLQYAAILD